MSSARFVFLVLVALLVVLTINKLCEPVDELPEFVVVEAPVVDQPPKHPIDPVPIPDPPQKPKPKPKPQPEPKAIDWQPIDPNAIHASPLPKLVLLGFEGCVPCRQLDNEVLTKPQVIRYVARNFQSFHADVMKQPKYQKWAKTYPTLVVCDPAGKEVGRIETAILNPAKFLNRLEPLRSLAMRTKDNEK